MKPSYVVQLIGLLSFIAVSFAPCASAADIKLTKDIDPQALLLLQKLQDTYSHCTACCLQEKTFATNGPNKGKSQTSVGMNTYLFRAPDYLYCLRELPADKNYPADHILFFVDGESLYALSYNHSDHYVKMPLTADQKQRTALPQLVDTADSPLLDLLAGSAVSDLSDLIEIDKGLFSAPYRFLSSFASSDVSGIESLKVVSSTPKQSVVDFYITLTLTQSKRTGHVTMEWKFYLTTEPSGQTLLTRYEKNLRIDNFNAHGVEASMSATVTNIFFSNSTDEGYLWLAFAPPQGAKEQDAPAGTSLDAIDKQIGWNDFSDP